MGIRIVAAAVALAAASRSLMKSPTRDAYVDRLERICKPRAASDPAGDGGRAPGRPLAEAARRSPPTSSTRRASIFGGTIKTIGHVPRPAADVARLEGVVHLPEPPGGLPRRNHRRSCAWAHTIKAQRLTARFIHNGNLANNVTLAFGFDYCSFKFSRYG